VALRALTPGQILSDSLYPDATTVVRQPISPGHKVALSRIESDQQVVKYGWPIGRATETIAPGEHVHTHNLRFDHSVDLQSMATEIPEPPVPVTDRTFQGFVRASGRAGTRNYIAVISTVNCSALVARYVAQRFTPERLREFPNVDGVIALKHEGGCAMPFEGLKHRMLNRVLGGMARHPNIGGFVLVGLGCEQTTIGHLLKSQNLIQIQIPGRAPRSPTSPGGVPAIAIQDAGGTSATIEQASAMVQQMLPEVNAVRRQSVPAKQLILGTECGGSDGYSGITANPAVGVAADWIVACGGTAIVSETPELFGAEPLLVRRARSRAVAEKLLERIEWWKWYAGLFGEALDGNPSAGNKAGGLTTIIEKSLGAAAKGGSTALEAVYEYAEPVQAKGLVVMDSPGFDPASVTGMVAGGANLVVFTTGRGSCFGFKPVPSLKISTTSDLYRRMPDDMDVNAGTALEGESVQTVGHRIFEKLLAVASGEKTKSEILGYGDDEFVPWTVGPTL
jgi:altronate dehydratase